MKRTVQHILLLFLIVSPIISFGQSQAINNFAEKADGYNVFAYQSVIRVFNKDKNEDFNMLIKDLDHIKILITDSIGSESTVLYKKLEKELTEEKYEELMSFENVDSEAIVFSRELDEGIENWVVIFSLGELSGLLEMRGSIDTNYLKAISSLNLNMLKTILPKAGSDN